MNNDEGHKTMRKVASILFTRRINPSSSCKSGSVRKDVGCLEMGSREIEISPGAWALCGRFHVICQSQLNDGLFLVGHDLASRLANPR